jgi:hypothetical protein
MKTVKYDVKYEEHAGRLELFIRWVWMIPTAIVLCILEIIGCIAMFFQWIHILILGKKNQMLHDLIKMMLTYNVKFMTYFYMLTDERNPIMPETE